MIAALPVCVTGDADAAREPAGDCLRHLRPAPLLPGDDGSKGVAGPADLAIVGSAAEVQDRIGALTDVGVTDFVAAEFGVAPDEKDETRAALQRSSEPAAGRQGADRVERCKMERS